VLPTDTDTVLDTAGIVNDAVVVVNELTPPRPWGNDYVCLTRATHFRFRPDAVTDHLTRLGPVFLRASDFEILDATFFGLHAG
jgi:hypothetical protein